MQSVVRSMVIKAGPTLIGVIVGGLITCISSWVLERQKQTVERERSTREKQITAYCRLRGVKDQFLQAQLSVNRAQSDCFYYNRLIEIYTSTSPLGQLASVEASKAVQREQDSLVKVVDVVRDVQETIGMIEIAFPPTMELSERLRDFWPLQRTEIKPVGLSNLSASEAEQWLTNSRNEANKKVYDHFEPKFDRMLAYLQKYLATANN